MNPKHFCSGILSLTFLWSACQPHPTSREEFVRAYFEQYPEATLLDIYKGSFQDTFGPSHLITDREAVIRYIESELKSSTSFEAYDYQPCGWQGNFYQVNLKVVADGRVPMDVFADAFMASTNGIDTTLTQAFVKDWQEIQQAVHTAYPQLEGYREDSTLLTSLLTEGKYVIHHSSPFSQHYHPHYRIIRRDIFEEKILPRL